MVPLMRCLASHLGGHRSVQSDSHKTFEFSAPKSCVEKRMRIRDVPSRGSRQTVVFWLVSRVNELTRLNRVAAQRDSRNPIAQPAVNSTVALFGENSRAAGDSAASRRRQNAFVGLSLWPESAVRVNVRALQAPQSGKVACRSMIPATRTKRPAMSLR
jgi:hypothetical protein